MASNHITTNIITKGWMNESAITKGFISPAFQYIIVRKRKGGSPGIARDSEYLEDDLRRLRKIGEEVDYIQVYVNWNKHVEKYDKKIYANLIKQKIEVQLLTNLDEKFKIKVKLIEDN